MKILFYSDSLPIGGHELMSIRLANYLNEFEGYNVSFLASKNILSKLDGSVTKYENNIKPRPLNGSLGHLFLMDYYRLYRMFKSINPELIVVCQGTIELGVKACVVARFLDIKVVSYIPFVIDLLITGSKFFPILRNKINDKLYTLPNGFITISDYHKEELKLKTKTNVAVLHNWIESKSTLDGTDKFSREDIFIWAKAQKTNSKFIILIIGRIEFEHKQQNKFLNCIFEGALNKNISVLIAGEGSDSRALVNIIREKKLDNIYYAGNVTNVDELYGIVDGTCICSSFEGVPLVLLESINANIPVFSFAFDGVKDYLPSEFLVEKQNFPALVERINSFDFSKSNYKYDVKYNRPLTFDVESVCNMFNQI